MVNLLFYRVVSGLEDEGRNSDSSCSLLPKDRVMVLILAWKPRRAGHFVIGTAYQSKGHLELYREVSREIFRRQKQLRWGPGVLKIVSIQRKFTTGRFKIKYIVVLTVFTNILKSFLNN